MPAATGCPKSRSRPWRPISPKSPNSLRRSTTSSPRLGVNLAAMPNTLYGTTVQIQQAIWDGGLIKAQTEAAKAESEVSRRRRESEMYALTERVNQALFRFAAASGEYRHRRPDDRRPAAQLQDARIHGGIRHGRKERPRHAEGGDTRRPAAACTGSPPRARPTSPC